MQKQIDYMLNHLRQGQKKLCEDELEAKIFPTISDERLNRKYFLEESIQDRTVHFSGLSLLA